MTRMLPLAALALACVASPAFAMAYPPGQEGSAVGLARGLTVLGLCFVGAGALFLLYVAPRRPIPMALAAVVGLLWFGSALAAECPPAASGWDWISYTVFFAVFAAGLGISVWREHRRARRDMQAWADHLRKPCLFALIVCGAAAIPLVGARPASAANAIAGHIQGGSGETLFGLTVGTGLIMLSIIAGGCAAIWSGRPRIRDAAAVIAGLSMFLVIPGALAAEVATVGDKAVILPWGDWLVALAVSLREPILTILIPIIAGYAIQAIRKVYPWAALFLSQRRVEMMLEAAVGYGLNAVNGAAKGKTLSVNVAVPVIAKGTQYVIDTAPPAVIKAAGGADGIAARIFRKLDLDDGASEQSVLIPAQVQLGADTVTADELRDADRMSRG